MRRRSSQCSVTIGLSSSTDDVAPGGLFDVVLRREKLLHWTDYHGTVNDLEGVEGTAALHLLRGFQVG